MAQPSEAWRPSFNDAPGSVGAALVWALSQFCNKVFPAPAPPVRASCGAVKNLILRQCVFPATPVPGERGRQGAGIRPTCPSLGGLSL